MLMSFSEMLNFANNHNFSGVVIDLSFKMDCGIMYIYSEEEWTRPDITIWWNQATFLVDETTIKEWSDEYELCTD